MKDRAQVVVIGGGVVGCSVLYHLTKRGWRDVLLIERDQLTSGSTWHAAGGMHTLNGDPNVARLQQYTIDLYEEIETISGVSCGVHVSGGIMLADTRERMQWLKMAQARGRYLGMETELISVSEARKLLPLLDERYFVGAMWDPVEGHVDPSGVTHAYARAARLGGAGIELNNRVVAINQRPDRHWDVVTEKGVVRAEHVVNAGGLWAREVGRMVELELPLLAMEHMYLLTDAMPEVAAINRETGGEVVHAIDFGAELYLRQEGQGMLMGTYEKACVPWSERETPWDFGHELLASDMDRIAPSLQVGFSHFPAFENAGIKQIVNGPFTFAPDGNPVVGPVPGKRGLWCACGVMAGFSQGGGVGLALTNWMIDGEPGFDVFAMDVARFGDWTSMRYTNDKVRENYARRFSISFPNEELPAGRPLRTTPIYDRLAAKNAVFGAVCGLEHAVWFQTPGKEPVEDVTFKRSNAFDVVAQECDAIRNRVAMIENSNFAKYEVTGPDAEAWLAGLFSNALPERGRLRLTPMLNDDGRIVGEFSLTRLNDEKFLLFGSLPGQDVHMRWFLDHLNSDDRAAVRPLGLAMTCLSVVGPQSRQIVQSVTADDMSAQAFAFLDVRRIEIGLYPVLAARVTFTGDLGWELWMAAEHMTGVYDLLVQAGATHDMRLFGWHALNSCRLEKGFGTWIREYRPVYTALEAGMERFIDMDKGDFIGRAALLREREDGPARRLVCFRVDAADADVIGDEPIWHADEVIGWVTSGGFGHHVGASIALGYVPAALSTISDEGAFSIEIIGERRPATLVRQPLFDPGAKRMRM